MSEVFERPAVRRLASNALNAQKRYHEAQALLEHPPDRVRETWEYWASNLNPRALKAHFVGGSIDIVELEGLLDYALRAERL